MSTATGDGLRRGTSDDTITVASGTDVSTPFTGKGSAFGMIKTPAAMTSTTATLEGCRTKTGTYLPLYDAEGTAISIALAVDRWIEIPHQAFGVTFCRLKFGSTEAAARELEVSMSG